ncbi:MAG: DUF1273 family protein [Clostridia bacterium]|nr:DUF1273 family protein [Clostridia bacterium]
MNLLTEPYVSEREKTCCFTGHRAIPSEHLDILIRALDETIRTLYEKGVTEFRAGGALGFDTIAALRVLWQKQQGLDVHLHLLLPCRSQADRWPPEARLDYNFILSRADTVYYVSEAYTPSCMHTRNRALVDGSAYCVSYLLQNKGGTAYTVSYALKNGLSLINLGERFL